MPPKIDPKQLSFRPIDLPDTHGEWMSSQVPGYDFDLYLPAYNGSYQKLDLEFFLKLDVDAYLKEALRFSTSIYRNGYIHEEFGYDSVFVFPKSQEVLVELWFEDNPYMRFNVLMNKGITGKPSVLKWGGEYC